MRKLLGTFCSVGLFALLSLGVISLGETQLSHAATEEPSGPPIQPPAMK
ncbi:MULTISPECIES: hypothetical protein [Bacillus]|nr:MULTISPECIES: hypothetical protein [Bacillus]